MRASPLTLRGGARVLGAPGPAALEPEVPLGVPLGLALGLALGVALGVPLGVTLGLALGVALAVALGVGSLARLSESWAQVVHSRVLFSTWLGVRVGLGLELGLGQACCSPPG